MVAGLGMSLSNRAFAPQSKALHSIPSTEEKKTEAVALPSQITGSSVRAKAEILGQGRSVVVGVGRMNVQVWWGDGCVLLETRNWARRKV